MTITPLSPPSPAPANQSGDEAEQCTIPVSGMTCAACSGRIQRTLETTPGVRAASVNLMTGSATVDYDPAATTPAAITSAVANAGYPAAPVAA